MLAVEVVGLLGTTQEQLRHLRQLAVEALQRLAQRPVAPGAPAQPGVAAAGDAADAHVLVAAAGKQLASLTGDGVPERESRTEVLALLHLLTEYASAVQLPSVAAAVVRHCLRGFQSLLGTLQAVGLDAALWPAPAWQLLDALVVLLAAVCRRCEDAEAGRGLLALLLGDRETAAMLSNAASHVLLLPEQQGVGAASMAQRSRTAAMQRDLLQLFAALTALVGRQPPCVHQPHHSRESGRAASRVSMSSLEDAGTGRDASEQGPGRDLLLGERHVCAGVWHRAACCSQAGVACAMRRLAGLLCAPASVGLSAQRGLTRRRALQFFSFLVSPHSGLAQRILDHDPSGGTAAAQSAAGGSNAKGKGKQPATPAAASTPSSSAPASAAALRLRQYLLELLRAVFAAPGSPFAADKFVTGGPGRASMHWS